MALPQVIDPDQQRMRFDRFRSGAQFEEVGIVEARKFPPVCQLRLPRGWKVGAHNLCHALVMNSEQAVWIVVLAPGNSHELRRE